MKSLLVASHKGGCGKTTTTLNLAAIFGAGLSGRVLVVDFDPVGGVAAALGLHAPEASSASAPLDQRVVPQGCGRADLILAPKPSAAGIVGDHLAWPPADPAPLFAEIARDGRWQLVLVDSPPGGGRLLEPILPHVDAVAMAIPCDPLGFRSATPVASMLAEKRAALARTRKKAFQLRFLLTFARKDQPAFHRVEKAIRGALGPGALHAAIPRDAAVEETALRDKPAWLARPDCPASCAYEEAAREIAELLDLGALRSEEISFF